MKRRESGLSLVELLVALTIVGIMVMSFHTVLGRSLDAYGSTKKKQESLSQVRFALDRMALFVRETDAIQNPDDIVPEETLVVSERVLDLVNNTNQSFVAAGDGLVDADKDGDGLVNEGGGDGPEWVTFSLDKTDPANWKLVEHIPDYTTVDPADVVSAGNILCDQVTAFQCARLGPSLVEISLTVGDGPHAVTSTTRSKARRLD